MNKFIVRFCTSVLFLLLIANDSVVIGKDISTFQELDLEIVNHANGGKLINDVLKLDLPEKGGRMGKGLHAIVWKGKQRIGQFLLFKKKK